MFLSRIVTSGLTHSSPSPRVYSRRISDPVSGLPSWRISTCSSSGPMEVAGLSSSAVVFHRSMCSSRSTACRAEASV